MIREGHRIASDSRLRLVESQPTITDVVLCRPHLLLTTTGLLLFHSSLTCNLASPVHLLGFLSFVERCDLYRSRHTTKLRSRLSAVQLCYLQRRRINTALYGGRSVHPVSLPTNDCRGLQFAKKQLNFESNAQFTPPDSTNLDSRVESGGVNCA